VPRAKLNRRSRSASPRSADAKDAVSAAVEITANGSRGSLEALYLELRELAKQHGLEVEYRVSKNKPD
jgi:hypothetical protein